MFAPALTGEDVGELVLGRSNRSGIDEILDKDCRRPGLVAVP